MPDIKNIDKLSKCLGHTFKKPDLLSEALRHASYVNELTCSDLRNNERLEFLGDSVIGLVISHILMDLFGDVEEGDLSKYRAGIVNENSLCQVAQELKLGDYIKLGRGEELSGGREKTSILANTLEAIIGALYLDAGFIRTKEIINRLFSHLLSKCDLCISDGDFKSIFQEYTQKRYKTRPDYRLMMEEGPPHDKIFRIALHLNGEIIAEGEGKSKKEAEQKAAREAFYCLTEKRQAL